MTKLCRYVKRRSKSEWAMLLSSYAVLAYVLVVVVQAQSASTYRFGSGTFGQPPQRTDELKQASTFQQSDEIAALRAAESYNIARIDALEKLDIAAQLNAMKVFMDDSKRTWDKILALGEKLLVAIIAGLVLNAWHVRQSKRPSADELRKAIIEAMKGEEG